MPRRTPKPPRTHEVVVYYKGHSLKLRAALIEAVGRKPDYENPLVQDGGPGFFRQWLIWHATQDDADTIHARLNALVFELKVVERL